MQADFTNETVRLICETIAQLESESNPVLRQKLSAVLQQTIVNLCSELQNENEGLRIQLGEHHAAIAAAQQVSDTYKNVFSLGGK